MHTHSLTPDCVQRIRLSDGLDTRIHVAQTARCESHSRFLAMLKETERRCVEWQRDDRAHDDRCFRRDESCREGGRDREPDQSKHSPTMLLPGA
jgi:hypothetical protein